MTRFVLASLLVLASACGPDDETPTGAETGPCYPNATCDMGLSCESDLCVDLDGSQTEGGAQGPAPGPESPPSPPSDSGDAPEEPPDEEPPSEDPSGDTGGFGETGSVPEDSCPFTEDGISCTAACAGEIAYRDDCSDDPYPYSLDECIEVCVYTQDNDLANDLWLELYGCYERTGGACEAFSECWLEVSC